VAVANEHTSTVRGKTRRKLNAQNRGRAAGRDRNKRGGTIVKNDACRDDMPGQVQRERPDAAGDDDLPIAKAMPTQSAAITASASVSFPSDRV